MIPRNTSAIQQGQRLLQYGPKPFGLQRRFHGQSCPIRIQSFANTNLPVQVDFLDRYQTLCTLGKITYHEDQVRLIVQLRKLQRELIGYAPPALSARLLRPLSSSVSQNTQPDEDSETPWWKISSSEEVIDRDLKALVTWKSHADEIAALTTPKGLLLTGPPGSGKSFIVDLWYSTLSTPYKARKHYNQLVLEIYRCVWEETQRRMGVRYASPNRNTPFTTEQDNSKGRAPWSRSIRDQWRNLVVKSGLPSKWTRFTPFLNAGGCADQTIAFTVAKRLVLRHWLLVFDEIQLLDVSSAGLLSDVLSWYWRMGGIIVGTSNKVPDDLYKNGVQRERLEPFVEALKARCPLYELDVKLDWREETGKLHLGIGGRTWFTADQNAGFAQYVQLLAKTQRGVIGQRDLKVFGRTLHIPWSHGSIARFRFSELCEESLGAADYLTLASTFSHIIITDIPVLSLSVKNQARRFISLIDALYESRCKLVCQAAALPEFIFFPDPSPTEQALNDSLFAESVTESREYYRPNVSYYDAPAMQTEVAQGVDGVKDREKDAVQLEELNIFSGKEEQFAFKRALSRIREMTSEAYNQLDSNWVPLPAEERKWEAKAPSVSMGNLPLASDHHRNGTLQNSSASKITAAFSFTTMRRQGIDSNTSGDTTQQPSSYASAEAIVNRPYAPHIRPDLHIWGMSEQSEQWSSLGASRRHAKGVDDAASGRTKEVSTGPKAASAGDKDTPHG